MELTKYEVARLLGARSLQLSLGAPPLIEVKNSTTTFLQIADIELGKNTLPLVVLRSEEN
ncbi:MAG: DNA-directed RNA polymerase subunit K [Candidatus Bilamarchaeum sp.]|jgi:DNA-directed RNA polymerase subunit K/omega